MRKTIEVEYLRERVNYFLANSEPEQADERKGAASVLELALHESGRYAGFGYLESAGVDYTAEDIEAKFANADETRRCYYKK